MWLSDQGNLDKLDKIICFSPPGGHMSWVAAVVGYIFDRWGIEEQIREDGSAHNVKEMLPHFSRLGIPFTIEAYDDYLNKNIGYNGNPTIYHDGFSSVHSARLWPRLLGEYGLRRRDTILIPIVCKTLQESLYTLLNVVSKQADDEMEFLTKLTGVSDDGSLLEEVYDRMSRNLIRPWALWSGMHVAKEYSNNVLSITDIRTGNILPYMISGPKLSYLKIVSEKYAALNSANWEQSLAWVERPISHWKPPTNVMGKDRKSVV